jgi:hypothetical protein
MIDADSERMSRRCRVFGEWNISGPMPASIKYDFNLRFGYHTRLMRSERCRWRLLLCVRDHEVRRRPPIQSDFSVLKTNLMAVPCIVVIFPVRARLQLDDPISSAASIQPGGDEQSI